MNTYGRIFRVSVYGESHGECLGALIDGVPPGIDFSEVNLKADLSRRSPGAPGTTSRREEDKPSIRSGVYRGKTTGAPVLIEFINKDIQSRDYDDLRSKPRPGHADFTAHKKYHGYNDPRGGGMFSGRLTAGIVAAGALAKMITAPAEFHAKLTEAGSSSDITASIKKALKDRDSVGGIIECTINGLPVGLGEPFFDSAESCISSIVFSIPGIKAIEFGAGFASAKMRGSDYNDEIVDVTGKTKSNNAGGINGGITNGNPIVFRVAVRPAASIALKQRTINMGTGSSEEIEIKGRHDACFAQRVPVIIEAAAAIALADLMLINNSYDVIPNRNT